MRSSPQRVFIAIALLLLSSGWAANHFASMLGVLREQQHLSSVLLNGAYGIYALGLLPCLLGGGLLSDRIGARPVVLSGGVIAALGNLSLMLWHSGAGLMTGRFLVGLGVGLAMSAGTAWAGQLRGPGGSTLAGIFLSLGFAGGPIASGLLAFLLPPGISLWFPFALSTLFSLATVALAGMLGDAASISGTPAPATGDAGGKTPTPRSLGRALLAALPVGLWVFSTATTAFVVLASRVAGHFSSGLLLPGIAAIFTFSSGLGVQMLGRRYNWGPGAGIAGALCAAAGMALASFGGAAPPLWVFFAGSILLGTAYGLCLQQGLSDIGTLSPPSRRGSAIGIFYVVAYLGFGLPVLLEAILPTLGASLPLLILAGFAVLCALIRWVQLSRSTLFH
ncbi:MFS transporter [Corynebacterium sp. A21]|uniref:MFS transporter n=1 Tax=Corynebacterium sp. A21 TaxID=3457318 RepID=UPI003FD1BD98